MNYLNQEWKQVNYHERIAPIGFSGFFGSVGVRDRKLLTNYEGTYRLPNSSEFYKDKFESMHTMENVVFNYSMLSNLLYTVFLLLEINVKKFSRFGFAT